MITDKMNFVKKKLHGKVAAKVKLAGFFVFQDVVAGALGDDLAVVDDDGAVGYLKRVADVVVGDKDAYAALF